MSKNKIPKIENKLEILNQEGERPKIILYGTIRKASAWENEDDVISANKVQKLLAEAKGKDIDIHINSGGGDVFESIAIGNNLKQHQGEVDIYIDGLAASGASIIAAAGDNVYMYPNSTQMIHNAWTIAIGNSKELRKQADDLDKIDSSVTASYMDKFVGTEEELKVLLADESFLTAEECLTFGLCTKIIENTKKETEPETNIKASLFEKYKFQNSKENLLLKFKNREVKND